MLIERVEQDLKGLVDASACSMTLATADLEIAKAGFGGETTGVLVVIENGTVVGACVGDSTAYLLGPPIERLTIDAQAQPRVGTGEAFPVPFAALLDNKTLLLATDGLTRYASDHKLIRAAGSSELDSVAEKLIASVRLPEGQLQDDVGLILVRDRTVPRILRLEHVYGLQMADIRRRVLRFGATQGWGTGRRGRKAHASIRGPVREVQGVIDIEMLMDGDWEGAPPHLVWSSPFSVFAAVFVDTPDGRKVDPEPLLFKIEFRELGEALGRILDRAWRHVQSGPDRTLVPHSPPIR